MISGAHVRERTEYRREREGAIRSKRVDMLWIWSVYSCGDKFLVIAVIEGSICVKYGNMIVFLQHADFVGDFYMKPTDFQRWLTQADELTPFQRERALETITSQNPERASADVIEERVADERRCPKENACNPKSWLIEAMGAVPG
jgi:hypothetical protein